jgi:hypothetical protein
MEKTLKHTQKNHHQEGIGPNGASDLTKWMCFVEFEERRRGWR